MSESSFNKDTAFKIISLVVLVGVLWFFGSRYAAKHAADNEVPKPATAPLVADGSKVTALPSTPEVWTAIDNNATTMTGDISVSASAVTILKASYPIAPKHTFSHAEMLAAANLFSTTAPPGSSAEIYSIDIPAKVKLLNKDPMCPADPAKWVIALIKVDPDYAAEDLYLGFFSGSEPPALSVATISKAPTSCGTFAYRRAVTKAP